MTDTKKTAAKKLGRPPHPHTALLAETREVLDRLPQEYRVERYRPSAVAAYYSRAQAASVRPSQRPQAVSPAEALEWATHTALGAPNSPARRAALLHLAGLALLAASVEGEGA